MGQYANLIKLTATVLHQFLKIELHQTGTEIMLPRTEPPKLCFPEQNHGPTNSCPSNEDFRLSPQATDLIPATFSFLLSTQRTSNTTKVGIHVTEHQNHHHRITVKHRPAMGLLRKTSKQTTKLKSLLRLAVSRIAVARRPRLARKSIASSDVSQLLALGHLDRALNRVCTHP